MTIPDYFTYFSNTYDHKVYCRNRAGKMIGHAMKQGAFAVLLAAYEEVGL